MLLRLKKKEKKDFKDAAPRLCGQIHPLCVPNIWISYESEVPERGLHLQAGTQQETV